MSELTPEEVGIHLRKTQLQFLSGRFSLELKLIHRNTHTHLKTTDKLQLTVISHIYYAVSSLRYYCTIHSTVVILKWYLRYRHMDLYQSFTNKHLLVTAFISEEKNIIFFLVLFPSFLLMCRHMHTHTLTHTNKEYIITVCDFLWTGQA